jgi:hypothetical protein
MKGTDAMNDPNRLPTEQEIIERLMASRKKPKLIPKPTVRERVEQRFSTDNRTDEAVFDHLTREAAEAKRRLELREAINNHPEVIKLRMQRLGIICDPIAQAHDRYYRACTDIVQANADIAAHSDGGYHRGPGED